METETTTEGLPIPPHVAATVDGGPSHTMEAQAPKTMAEQLAEFQTHGRSSQPEEEAPAPLAPKEEVWLGDKRYTTEDIERLERVNQEYQKAKSAPVVTPPMEQSPEEDLTDLMFSDPKAYTQRLEQRAAAAAENKILSQRRAEKVRNDFYDKNKDLKEHEDLVEWFADKMRPTLAGKSDQAALLELAQAVRNRVAKIKGSVVATDTLSSKPAVTAGATGNPTARAAIEKQGPQSFVDQMQQSFRKKGKTRY